MTLPQKIKGQYWIYDSEFDGDTRMVSVEGINNEWILKSTRQVKILDSSGNGLKNTVIEPMSIYVLGKANGEKVFVFTEPITENRLVIIK